MPCPSGLADIGMGPNGCGQLVALYQTGSQMNQMKLKPILQHEKSAYGMQKSERETTLLLISMDLIIIYLCVKKVSNNRQEHMRLTCLNNIVALAHQEHI